MYENGQTSYLEALLSSRNISEFLNSADYIAQIQSYDRQKLTEYQDTVESIVNLEAQLEQEYTDLEALKSTVESNKATVAAMKRQKESELADISGDIEDAQSDADYYAAEIQAQEELLRRSRERKRRKRQPGWRNIRIPEDVPVAVPEQHTGDQRLWNESIPDVGSVVEP